MKTSYRFLKYYVPDLAIKGKEFSERITMTGTKIEIYEFLDKNLSKIVVGKLLKIDKHENADKLVVCQVDIGSEQIQIVTGAKNVYVGMLCPVVLVGGKVAASAHDDVAYENGIVIKKGKLRGVESNGMLCSIGELGRPIDLYKSSNNDNGDGIYDLSNYDCSVGDDCIKLMSLDDCIYDFEITSNRIDCYSVKGIAKEVAATFDLQYKQPDETFNATVSMPNYLDLKVLDTSLCPLFATRLIKNVKIAESPKWLKDCLRAVGIRPINNIVDITNFVMVEYGQPMHAYDYDTIENKQIVVKRASDNEKFISLDGQEHILDNSMLTINDGKRAVGLAGVMGGENTMITDKASTVLFEAANFNGANVRRTSQKLGMRTEASSYFEKGLDPNNALKALDRACNLIVALKCGEVIKEQVLFIADENIKKEKVIEVSAKQVNNLIGKNFSTDEMKKILDKIDLKTTISNDTLIIQVPTIRKDIENFADISEEIIRFYGYDKIGMTLPNVNINSRLKNNNELVVEEIYNTMLYSGFSEIMNYSFESERVYQNLNLDINTINPIKLLNPLGEDFSYMRTNLVNAVLFSLGNNYKKQNKNIKLFEFSNVYLRKDDDENLTNLPDERKQLTFAGDQDGDDFYTYKDIVDKLLCKVGINNNILYKKDENIKFFHPYRTADIFVDDDNIGYIGEVLNSVSKNYGIEKKVILVTLDIDKICKKSNFVCKYKTISKFPSLERDLAIVLKKEIESQVVYDIINKFSKKYLSSIKLFDVYEGKQLQEGYKSLAYKLIFSSNEETLNDNQVDEIINNIIIKLKEINAELRS